MVQNYKEELKPLVKVLLSQDLKETFSKLTTHYLSTKQLPANGSSEQLYNILLLAVDDAKLNKPSSSNPIYQAFYNLAIETLQEISICDSNN